MTSFHRSWVAERPSSPAFISTTMLDDYADGTIVVMSDRDDVVEIMTRYGVMIDRRDWDGLAACFTDDCVADYQGWGEFHGGREVSDFCRTSVDPLDATQHLFGNFLVELDGDGASVQYYVQAQHFRASAPGGATFTVGGHYDNTARRTREGWRISSFVFRATWTAGNPDVLGHQQMDERVPGVG
jgi:3-phenylpropionate/cinnamic acid dioxygenase small subunit